MSRCLVFALACLVPSVSCNKSSLEKRDPSAPSLTHEQEKKLEAKSKEPIDRRKLYPVIVPSGYLESELVQQPFLDDLQIALVMDFDGMVRYVNQPDLAQAH